MHNNVDSSIDQKQELVTAATVVAEISALQFQLEALADAGEWSALAAPMRRRDDLLLKVPVNERVAIFTEVLNYNDRLLPLAREKRQRIADQLSGLRRGRENAGRYAEVDAAVLRGER